MIRDGKCTKDRYTMLPRGVAGPLTGHLQAVRRQHEADLESGWGRVSLPHALERKYPSADKDWIWQSGGPATRHRVDRSTGQRRRHHLHESVLQRAVKEARLKAGVSKPVS